MGVGSGRGAEWRAATINNCEERMGSGEERKGADGERQHKKLLFLETFLRYFGKQRGADAEGMRSGEERRGADGERLGRMKNCLQLYSIGRYISSSIS